MSLSPQDERKVDELREHGLSVPLSAPKNVFLAGGLNLLGGIGNFYLAYGKDGDSYQVLYGLANILAIVVLSPLWSVPQAMIDAYTLNKKAFVDYYSFSTEGMKEFQRLNPEAAGHSDYREKFDDENDGDE